MKLASGCPTAKREREIRSFKHANKLRCEMLPKRHVISSLPVIHVGYDTVMIQQRSARRGKEVCVQVVVVDVVSIDEE